MNKYRLRIIIGYATFLLVLLVIQFSIPDTLTFSGVKPDLLFVFAILAGYLYGITDAIVIGLITGFIRDAYAGRFIGLGMLLCLYCSIIAAIFLKRFLSRNIFLALLQVVFATFIYQFSLAIISAVFFAISIPLIDYIPWIMANRLLPSVIMNLAAAVIIYFLLKITGPYKKKSALFDEDEGTPGDAYENI
ncbi:MAG: rod shape-determining protein MreD [Saccharofermentanales bacterium]